MFVCGKLDDIINMIENADLNINEYCETIRDMVSEKDDTIESLEKQVKELEEAINDQNEYIAELEAK